MTLLPSFRKKLSWILLAAGILVVVFTTKVLAFHIVGGEIELIHLNGFNYRINVIQYFDRAQTFNPGPEAQIFVFTYRKSDQELMRIDTLLLTSQEPVLYTNPECAIAQLNTERVLFTKENNPWIRSSLMIQTDIFWFGKGAAEMARW